jgi:hypothetical protein
MDGNRRICRGGLRQATPETSWQRPAVDSVSNNRFLFRLKPDPTARDPDPIVQFGA